MLGRTQRHAKEEGLFSFSWEGLILERITKDLHPLIFSYFYKIDRPLLRENYGFKTAFGKAGTSNGEFNSPYAISVDQSGNIFVADRSNMRIQIFDPNGQFLRPFIAESTADTPRMFTDPTGIAFDLDNNLAVVDRDNDRVVVLDPKGNHKFTMGSRGSAAGQFSSPDGIAVDTQGNFVVTDFNSGRVQMFDPQGNFLRMFGSPGDGPTELCNPVGIAVDIRNDNIVVCDFGNHRISIWTNEGTFIKLFPAPISDNDDEAYTRRTNLGQLSYPVSLTCDRKGNILVVDMDNNRLQAFDEDGKHLFCVGGRGTSQGLFSGPNAVCLDPEGRIIVSDPGNHRIQIFE